MTEIDRSTLIRAFNDHLFEFLEDVLKLLPGNRSMITAIRSFQTATAFNKSIIIKCWHKYVYLKYSDVIEKGDITFFFEKDYSEDLTNLSNPDKVNEIIDSIRTPVKEICKNPVNKEHALTYIQNLSRLSVAYTEMQQ
jgi:hypothetical protein